MQNILKHLAIDIFGEINGLWAFLREPEIIKRDSETLGDIDLWCEEKCFTAVIRRLILQGWKLIGGRSVGNNYTLRFRHTKYQYPILELFSGGLRTGGIVYLKDKSITNNIYFKEGIPFISEESLLTVLITRVALRGALSGERLSRARKAWRSSSESSRENWSNLSSSIIGEKYTNKLSQLVSDDNNLISPPRSKLIFLAYLKQPHNICELAIKAIRIYFHKLFYRNQKERGVMCCLVGTDGSGKTSLSDSLEKTCSSFGREVYQEYWGRTRGNVGIVKAFREIVFRVLDIFKIDARPNEDLDVVTKDKKEAIASGKPLYKIFVSVGACVYFVEYWWRYFVTVVPRLRKGVIIILDRGPFDFVVMKGALSFARKLGYFGPRPSLLIYCTAPADIIHQRKPERTISEITNHQLAYKQLYEDFSTKIPCILLMTIGNEEEHNILCSHLLNTLGQSNHWEIDSEIFLVCANASSTN